jgi:hypothetical protein
MVVTYVNELAEQAADQYSKLPADHSLKERFKKTPERIAVLRRCIRGKLLGSENPDNSQQLHILTEDVSFDRMVSDLKGIMDRVLSWHQNTQKELFASKGAATYHYYKHRRSFDREAEVDEYFNLVELLVIKMEEGTDGGNVTNALLLALLGEHHQWKKGGRKGPTRFYEYETGGDHYRVRVSYYRGDGTNRRQTWVVLTCFRQHAAW